MDISIESVLDRKGRSVFSIEADRSVYEAIVEMEARNVGALIVMDEQGVAGIITERDYLRKVILKGRSSRDTPVATIMSRNLVSITPEDTVAKAMALMTAQRCRHLPVFKDRQLVGLVSVGDLIKATIAGQEFTIQMLEYYISCR
ncbi:MAG: CBS domain-containing protein [Pirellulaceae bacterium]